MKYLIYVISLILPLQIGIGNEIKENYKFIKNKEIKKENKINDLIEVLIFVESSNNDSAYNDKENAIGCLQIRPILIADVNRICRIKKLKKRYKHKDAWNRNKSIEIFKLYVNHYYNDTSFEVLAKTWNGGPTGIYKKSTEKYWNKVKYLMN